MAKIHHVYVFCTVYNACPSLPPFSAKAFQAQRIGVCAGVGWDGELETEREKLFNLKKAKQVVLIQLGRLF